MNRESTVIWEVLTVTSTVHVCYSLRVLIIKTEFIIYTYRRIMYNNIKFIV